MSKSPSQRDAWTDAWSERYEGGGEEPRRRRRLPRFGNGSRAGRYALASAVVIGVVGAPLAVAQTSGSGRFFSNDARYTLYAKNTRANDGGAGALVCQSNTGNEPCLSMVNKGNGYAGAFRTRGLLGFRLQTSGSGTATPFVLDKNATGKVEFLNSDQVDGLSADEIVAQSREPWALVTAGATPAIARGTTGTTVTRTAAGDYHLQFAQDVNACSYQVTPADPAGNRTVAAIADPGSPANNKQVRVVIKRAGGANEGELVDGDFQIAVHC
jgi:hypothetical protein